METFRWNRFDFAIGWLRTSRPTLDDGFRWLYGEAMRYLLPMLLYIGLTAFVIADIAQHRDQEPYRLPKVLWVLIVLFAPYVGALAWFFAKWSNPSSRSPRSGGYRAPNPDDDPDFKIWLNEQERRRKLRDDS